MNWPRFGRPQWSQIIGKPGWLSVFDGSYASLTGKPSIPSSLQRTRAQTNTSGVLTWTFPVAFAANPIIEVTVEDGTAATWNHQITSLSTTSVTIQITKTTAVTVLGVSVLGLAANPQAFLHVVAAAP